MKLLKDRIEISYLWIEKYKLFNDQNFNFTNKHFFEYNSQENTLRIFDKSNYIENFFGENITNITALVGKNGAGKTMALKYLKNGLPPLQEKAIFIFIKGETLHIIYTNINKKPKLIHNKQNLLVEYYCLDKEDYANSIERLQQNLGTINIVYFSNGFSNSGEYSKTYPGIISDNISTGFLAFSRKGDDLVYRNNKDINSLFGYDMMLMINFIIHEKNKLNDMIKPPISYIQFNCQRNYERRVDESNRYNSIIEVFNDDIFHKNVEDDIVRRNVEYRNKLFSKLNELLTNIQINKTHNSEKHSLYFKLTTTIDLIYDFYCDLYELRNIEVNLDLYRLLNLNINDISDINMDNFIGEIDSFFQKVQKVYNQSLKTLSSLLSTGNEFVNEGIKKIKVYREFINILSEFDGKWEIFDNYRRLMLGLNEDNIISLRKFYNIYTSLPTKGFYEFKWINEKEGDIRPLSSGEEALLKMYSRLYSLLKGIDTKKGDININNRYKNIIVLLDEPELYFHPEWQSKLIHLLIMYFKTIFRDYNIQIILTSNTPFLLSDLPRENVLLFSKELDINDNKFATTVDYASIPKTFGQNIHTLLKQAFFMETTIGEFAKEKINEIIRILNFEDEEKISDRINLEKKFVDQNNNIKKIINMIGEPLIRNYLEDLFQLKVIQSEKLTKEQKVNEIDLEIQRLIQKKNKLEISDTNLGDRKND